jgi:hypothetical protein
MLAAVAVAVAIPSGALAADGGAGSPALGDVREGPPPFDVRSGKAGRGRSGERRAQARLRRSLGRAGVVSVDRVTGTPRLVTNGAGFLTGRRAGRPSRIALDFVRRHAPAFGLDSGDLAGLRVAQSYRTRRGLTIVRWEQTYRGIPAFDNGLRAAIRGGRLVSLAGPAQPDLAVDSTTPRLSAAAAMRRALADVGVRRAVRQRGPARGARRRTRFSSGYAELTLFSEGSRARLAWKVYAFADSSRVYLSVVDATDGSVLRRANLVQHVAGRAHLYIPGATGGPALRSFDGWLTSGGRLIGNNAHVYSDQDDNLGFECGFQCNDLPEPGSGDEIPPSGGGNWNYGTDTSIGSGASGRSCPATGCTWNGFNTQHNWQTNVRQAGTQLFFFVNNFHDYLEANAGIQFGNASGNFEGADPVAAQVDDGAETGTGSDTGFPDCNHVNNASMLVLPENAPPAFRGPLMQMFLWTGFCDAGVRDVNGADDASIVYHEYTHGLSSRLVDPSGSGGLSTNQGGAMGEGWSDWYAMDYLVGQGLEADTANVNEILLAKYEVPGGLRRQGLDVPVGSGGYTYGRFGTISSIGPEVHADGEIWAETLWDLRRSLVSHYGAGTGALHVRALVTDAMRLGPSAPTFLDMRNAILAANSANGLGDCDRIWAVFAARGMGERASTTGPDDFQPGQDFTNPAARLCPHPVAAGPTAPAKASFRRSKRSIRVSRRGRFSFSFTAGPGLKGRITLKTVKKVRARKRSRRRRYTFGNKTFRVPASGKVKVRFKLSRRNFRTLKRYRKLRLSVTVKLRNSAGLTSTAKVRITLKAPRPRRR